MVLRCVAVVDGVGGVGGGDGSYRCDCGCVAVVELTWFFVANMYRSVSAHVAQRYAEEQRLDRHLLPLVSFILADESSYDWTSLAATWSNFRQIKEDIVVGLPSS